MVLGLLPELQEGRGLADSMVVNEKCDQPLELLDQPNGTWHAWLNLYSERVLGWQAPGFQRPHLCGYCLDVEAPDTGCWVCKRFLCVLCQWTCTACRKYVCASDLERFAHRLYPLLCRPCAERAWGAPYLEETDEMYRMHNEGVYPHEEE